MSQWKKIIFCSVMATLNVIPLCFVLWRVGDSIYNINSSEISNELKNVNFQIGKLNVLMNNISESLNNLDFNSLADRINTSVYSLTNSLSGYNNYSPSAINYPNIP
tara:strand:+ start:179 stop:496 length:318 start_codon:yes stop_codon:yes gene_type:complete